MIDVYILGICLRPLCLVFLEILPIFAVKAEKKAGKGKTKPVYKRFRQFFDFDKELKKMKNRRKPSRFAGITKLLDREE